MFDEVSYSSYLFTSGFKPTLTCCVNKYRVPQCWTLILSVGLWLVLSFEADLIAQSRPPLTADQVIGTELAKEAPAEFLEAVQQFNAGHFEAALHLLEQAATRQSDLQPGRPTLARFHLLAGRTAEARAMLELSVSQTPDEPETYRLLGELAFQEHRLTEAELLFRELLTKSNSFTGSELRRTQYLIAAHAGLAAVAERRSDWQKASLQLKEWITLDPKNAGAYRRYAEALFETGNAREAYSTLQSAQKFSQQPISAELIMGQLYHQAGNQANAEAWMKKAVAESPNHLHVLLAVAQWYWDTDQVELAQPHVDSALKMDPQSPQASFLAALIEWQSGDLDQAIEHFYAAAKVEPGNALIAHQLARALVDTGDAQQLNDARALAEASVRQLPTNLEVAATLGWVYLNLNLMEEAEQIFKRIAVGGHAQPDTAYYLACFAEQSGKRAAAIKTLRASLDAPGPFLHRKQAEQLLKQIDK